MIICYKSWVSKVYLLINKYKYFVFLFDITNRFTGLQTLTDKFVMKLINSLNDHNDHKS